MARLPKREFDWDAIRREREEGVTYKALSEKYGCSQRWIIRNLQERNGGVDVGFRQKGDLTVTIPRWARRPERQHRLGFLQEALVMAIWKLQPAADAFAIQALLKEAGKDLPLSQVYSALRQLWKDYRIIYTRIEDPRPGYKYRRRQLYYLKPALAQKLQERAEGKPDG